MTLSLTFVKVTVFKKMSLLNIDVGPLIQNWPLQAKADFANLLKNPFCTKDDWPVHNSVSKIHHLVQRSPTKKQEPPKMPVVFMPQKSETECERDRWAFKNNIHQNLSYFDHLPTKC